MNDSKRLPVFLNHFFIVLDSETFAAVSKSDFLKERFAVVEERTTSSQNQTWSGLYFYGGSTYFEFLSPESLNSQRGDCSIAFGVDQPGEYVRLEELLNGSGIKLERSIINRNHDGGSIPWFHLLLPPRKVDNPWFETWIMEYHKEFLSAWYPNLPPQGNAIDRRSILERYKNKVLPGAALQKRMFKEVTSVSVSLPLENFQDFVKWLDALGYRRSGPVNRPKFAGPEVEIEVTLADSGRKGITRATFLVNDSHVAQYRFGPRSVLKFNSNGSATWEF